MFCGRDGREPRAQTDHTRGHTQGRACASPGRRAACGPAGWGLPLRWEPVSGLGSRADGVCLPSPAVADESGDQRRPPALHLHHLEAPGEVLPLLHPVQGRGPGCRDRVRHGLFESRL